MSYKKIFIHDDQAIIDIKKLLKATHEIKQVKDQYDYDGTDITDSRVLATSYSIKDSLKKEHVDWEKQQHHRDMLDIIVDKTFLLAYSLVFDELKKQKKAKKKKKEVLDQLLGKDRIYLKRGDIVMAKRASKEEYELCMAVPVEDQIKAFPIDEEGKILQPPAGQDSLWFYTKDFDRNRKTTELQIKIKNKLYHV